MFKSNKIAADKNSFFTYELYCVLCTMREEARIRKVEQLLQEYRHEEPLARYLKAYFAQNRNMGGRDRRETREWMFNFFRLGNAIPESDFLSRLATANFLCSTNSYPSLDYLLSKVSGLNGQDPGKTLEEKIQVVRNIFPEFKLEEIFPFSSEISPRIQKDDFYLSFLKQPFVWIRVRRKFLEDVKNELTEKGISYITEPSMPLALGFQNSVALNTLISFEKGWFEIQDLNSQKTGRFFEAKEGEKWWDACAASGGKSLLLKDLQPGVDLLSTDNRESILMNLKLRMAKAGIGGFRVELLDLLHTTGSSSKDLFDGIIADVPCTGSGTWTRTPENLKSFNQELISKHFVPLQRKIVSNLTLSLKNSGTLVFITCSIFEKENEGNIQFFEKNLGFSLISSEYLEGSAIGADTLFVARLKKKLH